MFAALKMAMTGVGVMLMVFLARYRFMRLLRVEWVLYGVLIAYAASSATRSGCSRVRSTCRSCNSAGLPSHSILCRLRLN